MVNVACLVATGVNADGHREILGVEVCSAESEAGWLQFFRGLSARWLVRGVFGQLRRPHRSSRCARRDPARCGLAAVPYPLRREALSGAPGLHVP